MIYVAIAALILYGLFYAVKPELFLRRKYGEEPPAFALRVARFTGIFMVLAGSGWLVVLLSSR